MLLLDRIYKACIRQCWYLHTVAYMYVNIHVHTLMQLGFMHTNVIFQIRVLSIQNQQFEHVNAAGQYSVKLNMLLMLDWADMHPGSVRYCGSIHMQIQFVVLVAQCPSTFCLFLLHFDTYQDSASCYEPIPIHFNLLFLWVNNPSQFRC